MVILTQCPREYTTERIGSTTNEHCNAAIRKQCNKRDYFTNFEMAMHNKIIKSLHGENFEADRSHAKYRGAKLEKGRACISKTDIQQCFNIAYTLFKLTTGRQASSVPLYLRHLIDVPDDDPGREYQDMFALIVNDLIGYESKRDKARKQISSAKTEIIQLSRIEQIKKIFASASTFKH